jgi:hypothetical protein
LLVIRKIDCCLKLQNALLGAFLVNGYAKLLKGIRCRFSRRINYKAVSIPSVVFALGDIIPGNKMNTCGAR